LLWFATRSAYLVHHRANVKMRPLHESWFPKIELFIDARRGARLLRAMMPGARLLRAMP
jgi:hypothetical protein